MPLQSCPLPSAPKPLFAIIINVTLQQIETLETNGKLVEGTHVWYLSAKQIQCHSYGVILFDLLLYLNEEWLTMSSAINNLQSLGR